ncbi:MAG: glycosyltransferase family 2 protein [Saprospiraceae bacterium]|nr:glycosyltransferase family 2 protein [Saprospiraceae bacterium]MCF8248688.1 glycosyltransferase family 2 protein [Saprospiraceae bacterium]MCF8278822.1 glycosyltransferase family 2 protein [Bacteroidales bacterium]MCF8310622.1 glycosyltransferase family 2 protein [Saprospiraceae bacterium]MCF8439181.1 glycosyltransferase family 2 protein [Saprospiraceae bacterium]
MTNPIIGVIIPAFNEEKAVGLVVAEIPKHLVSEIVVVDNNSTDKTAIFAAESGATALSEKRQGYGWACTKAIEYFQAKPNPPDIVVFLDADHSDYPEEMTAVLRPILEDGFDMVIGSRALGKRESGSMTPQQVFGNWLATTLMRWFYGVQYTDLGPFRAIRFEKLLALEMSEMTYGWTVEMQVKAAKQGMKCCEVPVNYRQRIGFSKVSGTVKGTIGAGYKILATIFRLLLK